jgi:hypothetical protein
VLLRSLYEDAAVRTIASQWNSDQKHAGWSLGVTSTKSKYEPRNLILQFVGETKEGKAYEVLPSNLRLELNKPYYVAASVRLSDLSDKGVTFWLRDLSRADAVMQTAAVPHKVTSFGTLSPFVIGGRAGNERHRWDGLLDDVRLTGALLTADQLTIQPRGAGPSSTEKLTGSWKFELDSGVLHDSSRHRRDLTALPSPTPATQSVPVALADLCHVLLNSSEFLYVE